MSAPVRRALVALLLCATVGAAAGCELGEDDEMARPTRTVTATPTTTLPPLPPETIPVASGAVRPGDVVWAQGSNLHVGDRVWDLQPRQLERFVVVRGGVFFLEDERLWFTDLVRLQDVGVTQVTSMATDTAGTRLLLTLGSGAQEEVYAWNATSGASVPPGGIERARVEDRLGRADLVAVRGERSDVAAGGEQAVRLGPGGYGIVGGDGEPLVVFDRRTRQRVVLRGVAGTGFELVRWSGPATFHGLAVSDGRPVGVLDCDAGQGRCRTVGRVSGDEPVVFESGT